MALTPELARRYENVRGAMAEHGLDALVVSGSEYTGFEGAVTYLTGFQIVHRYAYVVVPAEGEPMVVFPSEARYVGRARDGADGAGLRRPSGRGDRDRGRAAGWRRLGVYGLDYVMTVRDFRALDGFERRPFDVEFDLARSVKSEAELESVRDSVRINARGLELWVEHYSPGKTAAEVMAAAEEWFVAEGCGRLTMNMVLTGTDEFARPEFKIARREERAACVRPAVARDRRARECTGSRSRAPLRRAMPRSRTTPCGCWTPTSSTKRPRVWRCGRAPRVTNCTGRCRRGSSSVATTSAT